MELALASYLNGEQQANADDVTFVSGFVATDVTFTSVSSWDTVDVVVRVLGLKPW